MERTASTAEEYRKMIIYLANKVEDIEVLRRVEKILDRAYSKQ